MAPRLASRVLISAAIGLAAEWYCHSRLRAHPTELAHDFTYPITAARHLLADRNPYADMKPAGLGSFPEHGYLLCTLPAVLVAMPLARIAVYLAGAIFFGASSALVAFGATRGAVIRRTQTVRIRRRCEAVFGSSTPSPSQRITIPSSSENSR